MSKTSGKSCLIYYYVPEDKDDPELLNAFGINQAVEDVKVTDIKQAFPLDGEYTFRFKTKIGNSKAAWMDVKDDAKIPLSDGKIVMKVSRISWENKGGRPRVVQQHRAPEEVKSPSSDTHEVQRPKPKPAPQQSEEFVFEDLYTLGSTHSNSAPAATENAAATQSQQDAHNSHNLLDYHHPSPSSNSYNLNKDKQKKNDLLSFDDLF